MMLAMVAIADPGFARVTGNLMAKPEVGGFLVPLYILREYRAFDPDDTLGLAKKVASCGKSRSDLPP